MLVDVIESAPATLIGVADGDADQVVDILIRERVQHDAIDDRVHGGGGHDAEREREGGGGGEAGTLGEIADPIADGLQDGGEPVRQDHTLRIVRRFRGTVTSSFGRSGADETVSANGAHIY